MRKLLLKIYYRVRFGKVTWVLVATEANVASEYQIRDRRNRVVGYWAHGYYDPSLPYRHTL